jgi:CMP-2-keto-3-deoxyoctulosonic acid synthetase
MVEDNINKHVIATFTFTIQDVEQSTFSDSVKEIKLNNKKILYRSVIIIPSVHQNYTAQCQSSEYVTHI